MPEKKSVGRRKGSKSSYTVSSKALAQRRKNACVLPAETDEEKSYNSRSIEHLLRIQEIATHADRSDLNTLKSCFVAYLKLCQEDGFRVSNLAAYASMGMSPQYFELFKKRDDPEIREFCEMIRTTCAIARENLIIDNKLNPVIGIFWQRNFDGLRNDTEQVQAIQEQIDNSNNNQSYKAKYMNLVDE